MSYSLAKDNYLFQVSLEENGKIRLTSFGVFKDYYGYEEMIPQMDHLFDPEDDVESYCSDRWEYFPFDCNNMKQFYELCKQQSQ